MSECRSALVLTHRRPRETAAALRVLIAAAGEAGVELRLDQEELAKHELRPGSDGVARDGSDPPDLCLVLGGDGTILTALRRYAGARVPVFAVNFGEIGFLATIEPEDVEDGFRRAFAGDFEVLRLPGIATELPDGSAHVAMNDVALHRRPGQRVADLAYAVDHEDLGRVRCDGLVIATPAGSTGYNLANGGPVLAWGVEGFVVSFIAPHSLTARALVVAPTDRLIIHNASREEPVEVGIDGRPVYALEPAQEVSARFEPEQGHLAQIPGTSFYHRLREKFGRLAV
jgi:NAD+ kinase